jgi:uncharacterized secreted protein with C-terminal beta-propeller domain
MDKDNEYPWGAAFFDDLVYVTYRKNGYIRIFDISDPANPNEVGIISDGLKWPWNMVISGDYMHVTDYVVGVSTYDISDPRNPVRTDRLGHHYAVDLDHQGGFLYEGHYGSLRILNCRHSSEAPKGIVTVKYHSVICPQVIPADFTMMRIRLMLNLSKYLRP